MRDVVGLVSRLIHSTPLTPNLGTDDRLGRPSPFLNWKGRKKSDGGLSTPTPHSHILTFTLSNFRISNFEIPRPPRTCPDPVGARVGALRP